MSMYARSPRWSSVPKLQVPGMYGSVKNGKSATALMCIPAVIGQNPLIRDGSGYPAIGPMTAGVICGDPVIGDTDRTVANPTKSLDPAISAGFFIGGRVGWGRSGGHGNCNSLYKLK